MFKKSCIILGSSLLAITVALFFYMSQQLPEVILLDDLTVRQYEKVTNISFISEIKDGTIVTKSKEIDTTTLGKKKIVITIKNKFGKKRDYQYFITVIKEAN